MAGGALVVLVVASSPADPSAESSDWVVAVIVSAASFLRLHALLTSNKNQARGTRISQNALFGPDLARRSCHNRTYCSVCSSYEA